MLDACRGAGLGVIGRFCVTEEITKLPLRSSFENDSHSLYAKGLSLSPAQTGSPRLRTLPCSRPRHSPGRKPFPVAQRHRPQPSHGPNRKLMVLRRTRLL